MLKCDFGNLHREVELLEAAGARLLHWDVMDGHFVPNLSYGAMVIQKVRHHTGLLFDAHLMISHPEKYLSEYVNAGCDLITIHAEVEGDVPATLNEIRNAGVLAGLALNPNTPLSAIEPSLDLCDSVLVMSVEPGFGGQAFKPEVLDKVRQLRAARPDIILSIDGGIAADTIGEAARAGTDLFVVGSAIFETPDYAEATANLRQQALQNRSPGSKS